MSVETKRSEVYEFIGVVGCAVDGRCGSVLWFSVRSGWVVYGRFGLRESVQTKTGRCLDEVDSDWIRLSEGMCVRR